jgi:NAD(P)H-dependent FMN reductase
LRERGDVELEVLDLKDHELPNYNDPGSPNDIKGQFSNPKALEWNKILSRADAYVVVTPEYNHGYPASLKNALDWTYGSLARKPVAFLSYGTMGGARCVEQLRGVVVELQMAPMRHAVQISRHWELKEKSGALKPDAFAPYEKSAAAMIENLCWWGRALKIAREAK